MIFNIEAFVLTSFHRKMESSGTEKMVDYSYVYILASKRNGTLYIGVTTDLVKRVYEHKVDLLDGFTRKYRVHTLVYYESQNNIELAIKREKQMKAWRREWKLELVEKHNPEWRDLYEDIV
ncbi:MAG: GIY-YIG nuclease family protein [Dehalococcoidales bacterium]|nr:GIY-YIG nuclease family protein [Dehalococcoidales bacterium]